MTESILDANRVGRTWYGVIIDDQQACIDELLEKFEPLRHIEIVQTFTDEHDAFDFLMQYPVDFIIIDMELRHGTAFDFMRALPNPRIPTILYTAHRQYEDPGYEQNVLDVLHKPVSAVRLSVAMRRISEQLMKLLPHVDESLESHYAYIQLSGPQRGVRRLVLFKELVYIAMEGRKLCFYLLDGSVLESSRSFKEVWRLLPKKWFKNCAKNRAFNIHFFESYSGNRVILRLKKPLAKHELLLGAFKAAADRPNVSLPVGAKDAYPAFFEFLETNVL